MKKSLNREGCIAFFTLLAPLAKTILSILHAEDYCMLQCYIVCNEFIDYVYNCVAHHDLGYPYHMSHRRRTV